MLVGQDRGDGPAAAAGDDGFKTVMQRTQPEGSRSGPGDVDRTLSSLRRFVRLAATGNPSILIALWAPVDLATPLGHDLQSMGEAFVGRHVVPRYRGYMESQTASLGKLLDSAPRCRTARERAESSSVG